MKSFLRLTLFALASVFASAAMAQTYADGAAARLVEGSEKVVLDPQSGQPRLVVLNQEHTVPLANLNTWLRSTFQLPATHSWTAVASFTDKLGQRHIRLQQQVNGVAVQGVQLIAHLQNGQVFSVNGDYAQQISGGAQPGISEGFALQTALSHIDAAVWKWEETGKADLQSPHYPTGQLVWHEGANGWSLAWRFDVYASKPLNRSAVYVDAQSGKVNDVQNLLWFGDANGTAVTKYSGTRSIVTDSVSTTSYRLQEAGRGGGVVTKNLQQGFFQWNAVDFTDTDNYWNNANSNQDEVATDAHWAAEMVYDYFQNEHGRNSYDDAGAPLNQFVHYATNYPNAFWDGSSVSMGDGNGTTTGPWTSVDIVAHEYSHGVVENTANLTASYESGAIGEGIADIFGTLVENYAKGSINWLIGEDIVLSGSSLRNLANPNSDSRPDTYQGTNWEFGSTDNGGVHTNSAVMTYWFYLLVNGGAGVNDNGATYNVNGVGVNDAEDIIYRALATYLTTNSQFADARTYTIQAAQDLFGACSAEMVAVTNAWHAVGVGAAASNTPPTAGFTADVTYSCTAPQAVVFTNNSSNATSYVWDFGDGSATVTTNNPTHTYTADGVYTVTLLATGNTTCGTVTDTLVQTNYITIAANGGPVAASCTPTTTGYCCNMGIYTFSFGGSLIYNTSSNGSVGYEDFTCSNSATVTAGNSYNLLVVTGTSYTEDCSVWIDYNNDGTFATGELVYSDFSIMTNHSGSITIPTSGVALNTPLRMRVTTDYYNNNISSACYNPQYGQTEDYTIVVQPNTNPPTASFSGTPTTVNAGGTVSFSNASTNATSYLWYFPGASPSTSTDYTPTNINYATPGTYDVTLVATNPYGTDSVTLTNYISVVSGALMCSNTGSTAPTGTLYDSGGPSSYYSNNEYCTFLIDPGCNTPITLSFTQFQILSGDYLYVYDGASTAGTLMYSGNGSTIPSSITANSGQMFVVFYSNSSSNWGGFAANWTSAVPSSAPVASFTASTYNAFYGETISFTDQSTNSPTLWSWNFGDGNTSTSQNPTHSYGTAGTYTVQLIADNCYAKDTATATVVQNAAPTVAFAPDTITATVTCGDSLQIPLTVYNTGGGSLAVTPTIQNNNNNGVPQVLLLNYGGGAPTDVENKLIATGQFTTNEIDYLYQPSSFTVNQLLPYDVVFCWVNNTPPTNWGDTLAAYVDAGGKVILGTYGFSTNWAYTGAIMGAGYTPFTPGSTQSVSGTFNIASQPDPTHPIFDGLTGNPQYWFNSNFSDPALTTGSTLLASDNAGNNVIAINASETVMGIVNYPTYINSGNAELAQMYANMLYYMARGSQSADWLGVPTASDTVAAGDSTVVMVTLRGDGLNSGTYTTDFTVQTNDPANPTITVPVTMTVNGPAIISASDSCLNFGSIMQGTSTNEVLTIYNAGCDTLHITNITTGSALYSASNSAWTIPPGDTSAVTVTFAPTGVGTFNSNLNIFSDGGDTTICLQGVGQTAPGITVNPATLSATITGCNDSTLVPVTIHSTGGADLVFSFDPVSISYDSTSFQNFYSTGANTYHYFSNMPASDSVYVDLYLVGDFNSTTETAYLYMDGTYIGAIPDYSNTVVNYTYAFGGTQAQTWLADGQITVTIDNNTAVNTGYADIHQVTLRVPGANWINEPNSNTYTVAAGDSVMVQVPFTSVGTNPGSYTHNMTLSTNVPATPTVTIPSSLTIIGEADIALSVSCLNYGTVYQGTTNSTTFDIENTGCDTLFVTNIAAGYSDYTPSLTAIAIEPNATQTVTVDFVPASVGNFDTTLTISTNLGDTTICLTGAAIAAPDISVVPNPVTAAITACDDSTSVDMVIKNVGGANLTYSFGGVSAIGYDSTQTTNFNSTGAFTTFTFDGLYPADTVWVEITMQGDFNSTNEYADLYIEGQYQQQIQDYSQYNVNQTYYFTGSQVQTWLSDGQITVGLDNSASVNTGYGDVHTARVYLNSVPWISATSATGTLVSGDSTIVPINFYSANVASGLHVTDLTITSNDPSTPSVTVPCSLTVSGTPAIGLSTVSLDLDTAMVGASNSDSVLVYNTGCDTLFVTNIIPTNGAYSTNAATFSVAPGDSLTVGVTFSPTSIGQATGTIQLFNNDVDTAINLTGYGVGAPVISITPDSLNVTVNCGDSVTVPVVIGNIGAGPLNFEVDFSGNSVSTGNYDFYDGFEAQHYNQWSSTGSTHTYSILSSGCPVGNYCLQQSLGGSHGSGRRASFTAANPTYVSFWVQPGATNLADGYVNLRSNTNGYVFFFYCRENGLLGLYNSSSVNALINYTAGQWYHIEVKNIDWTAQTVDLYVDGNLVQASFPFRQSSTSAESLEIYNFHSSTVAYDDFVVGDGPVSGVDWLTWSPDSSAVGVGGSDTVFVQLNASGYSAGQYSSELQFTSNDPATPSVYFPVHMNVSGPPTAILSDTCLTFGNRVVGSTVTDTLYLANYGCDTLNITNMIPGSSVYTVLTSTTAQVGPEDTIMVVVEFNPAAITNYNSTLQIFSSNLSTVSVCLEGSGTGAPIISTSPNNITATLSACGDSVIIPVTIGNIGAGDLHYTVEPFATPFDSTSYTTITYSGQNTYHYFSGLSQSDSLYVTVTVSGDYDGGTEYATCYIEGVNQGTIPGTTVYNTAITYTYAFGGSQVQTWLADGQVNVTVDNSSAVDAIATYNYHQVQVQASGPASWVSRTPGSGTVTIGGSNQVDVEFNSTGLTPGQYTTSMVIHSDDPNNPTVSLPCTLDVVGTPCADFTYNLNPCTGVVTFADASSYSPTGWSWDFDGLGSSTSQNPSYTFTNTGAYPVTLIATNALGSDTVSQVITITTLGGPITPSCTPATTGYCCNMGIHNVTFAGISNATNDGSDGYQDYSCTQSATVTEGDVHTITVTTGGSYQEDVGAWIDYNNDGVFTTGEQILATYNQWNTHTASVTIPTGTAVLNTPLRLRIGTDYYNNTSPNGCSSVQYGQYEDYSIIILPQSQPPYADFQLNHPSPCEATINLTDASLYSPTGWTWDFGDSNGSTSQSPSHTYTTPGTYTVELIACNADGCDTTSQSVTITGIGSVTTAACYPQTTNNCCGFGIYNVSFNTINNTTNDGSDGYQDYSCTDSTTVYEGQTYTLSVTTSPTIAENVGVWIDFDNDGAFTSGEKVLTSNNVVTTHTLSYTIPTGSAVLYTPLRMRVGSDYFINAVPDGCTDLTYGQYEDYMVVIEPNNIPPVAGFSSNQPNGCLGDVDFTNSTSGLVTSYAWNFGDGATSTAQDPSHTYTSTGTFTVALIACNSNGCDTATQAVTISGLTDVAAPACYPQTTNYSGGAGITNVTLNTINYSSANASEGYQDLTCAESTDLTVTYGYSLSVTVGTGTHNVLAWIDYDNDGTFTSGEQVLSASGTGTVTTTVTPPSSATQNTPLRMRVGADLSSNPLPDGCTDAVAGQYEDYRIVLFPDTAPPVAGFTFTVPNSCEGDAVFTDGSTSGPAITSYAWDFGDANTSSSQHPTHTYTAAGTYTVQLIACNTYGCDTTTQSVTISGISPVATAACYPQTSNYCCGFGITDVQFGTISNATTNAAEGYQDFTCNQATDLTIGQGTTLSITTGTGAERVRAWIDYNNDGSFTASEQVLTSNSGSTHTASIVAPGTATTYTALRMRIGSESNTNSVPDGCTDLVQGQYEDYAVTIYPDTTPAVADFSFQVLYECQGVVAFTDASQNGANSWTWDFGDGNGSSAQSPTHTYTSAGNYSATLTACNAYGCDMITYSVSITSVSDVVTASCYPQTTNFCCGSGITDVQFGTISSATTNGAEGYRDLTCSQSTDLTIGQALTLDVITGTSSANVRAWIDYNNDGSFTASEEVLSSSGSTSHSGSVTAPSSAVTYTPLRLRIGSDNTSNPVPDGCADVVQGQYEDYAVIIYPDTAPPTASGSFSVLYECQGVVEFTDASLNGPSTWLWNFGDGNTANTPNATHTFAAAGTYNVTLTVCNAFGCDDTTLSVTLTGVSAVDTAVCYPQTTSSVSFGYGITNVAFNTINHNSGNGSEGYRDFTCSQSTTVMEGTTHQLEVTTSIGNPENARAWIDYNNDGAFDVTEEVLTSDNTIMTHVVQITIPSGTAVLNTPLRMRVGSDDASLTAPDGCTDVTYGQYEDYAVTILADTVPTEAGFIFSLVNNCGGEVLFFDTSDNNPTSWSWDFGDGATATNQNPSHTYTEAGTYNVTLTVTNAFGSDDTTAQVTINIISASFAMSGTLEEGQPLQFEGTANGGVLWDWDFGDGNTAGGQNPTYTYTDAGQYTVTMVATNAGGCSDTASQQLDIAPTGLAERTDEVLFEVQPNPTRGAIVLLYQGTRVENVEVTIHNGIGQIVHTFRNNQTTTMEERLNLQEFGSGVYHVRLKAGDTYLVKRIVVH